MQFLGIILSVALLGVISSEAALRTRAISLQCLGHDINPDHVYLDGYTANGGVGLAPSTTGIYTGTHWLPIELYDNIYAFYNLGTAVNSNYIYLDGRTGDGSVGLAPQLGDPYTGTAWLVTDEGNNVINLKCLGVPPDQDHQYLEGLVASGEVQLAPDTTGVYTGTHFEYQEVSFP